jgi:2-keto-4-pentenoate hydratase/2-oxohepta-3-ene-1,7-dioic acid hydratase in catechol pathway
MIGPNYQGQVMYMRFIAFRHNGQPALGLRSGAEIVDLGVAGLPTTLDELLHAGADGLAAARRAAQRSSRRLPIDAVEWLAPLQAPSKAIAVGLNYVDHATESKFEAPTYPVLFQRFPSS